MHVTSKARLKNPVIRVDHIAHLQRMIMPLRSHMKSQIRPVIHRQIFGPCSDGISLGRGPLLPDSRGEFQERTELFPSGGKTLSHESRKPHGIRIRKTLHGTLAHLDHRRLNSRPRPENIRGNNAEFSHRPAPPKLHRERSIILVPRRGRKALPNFPLYHQNKSGCG